MRFGGSIRVAPALSVALLAGMARAEWLSVGACANACSTAAQACADAAAFHHRALLSMYPGYFQGRLVGYFCDLDPLPINIGDSFTSPVCDILTEQKDATTTGGCVAKVHPRLTQHDMAARAEHLDRAEQHSSDLPGKETTSRHRHRNLERQRYALESVGIGLDQSLSIPLFRNPNSNGSGAMAPMTTCDVQPHQGWVNAPSTFFVTVCGTQPLKPGVMASLGGMACNVSALSGNVAKVTVPRWNIDSSSAPGESVKASLVLTNGSQVETCGPEIEFLYKGPTPKEEPNRRHHDIPGNTQGDSSKPKEPSPPPAPPKDGEQEKKPVQDEVSQPTEEPK